MGYICLNSTEWVKIVGEEMLLYSNYTIKEIGFCIYCKKDKKLLLKKKNFIDLIQNS